MDGAAKERIFRRLKYAGVILILIAIAAGCISCVADALGKWESGIWQYDVEENFRKHRKDFDTLVSFFSERFNGEFEKNDKLCHLYIDVAGDELWITYSYCYGGDSSPSDERVTEPMSEEIKTCFDNLFYQVFTRHADNPVSFVGVYMAKDQIAFCTSSPYAVIYAKHRPEYVLNSLHENWRVDYVDRIGWNWYQVLY